MKRRTSMKQEDNPRLISFLYYKATTTSVQMSMHANIICGFAIQCGRQIVGPGHIEEPCMTLLPKKREKNLYRLFEKK
jgi:hypothetical protein